MSNCASDRITRMLGWHGLVLQAVVLVIRAATVRERWATEDRSLTVAARIENGSRRRLGEGKAGTCPGKMTK